LAQDRPSWRLMKMKTCHYWQNTTAAAAGHHISQSLPNTNPWRMLEYIFTGRVTFCHPTNSIKALKNMHYSKHHILNQTSSHELP